MNVKLFFLHSHMDNFLEDWGDISDTEGERFHQYIKVMEERYQRH